MSAITNGASVDWRIRTVLALYPQRWHPLTTRGTQDYYGVHNPTEARTALASWEQHIPTC